MDGDAVAFAAEIAAALVHAGGPAALTERNRSDEAAESGTDDLRVAGAYQSDLIDCARHPMTGLGFTLELTTVKILLATLCNQKAEDSTCRPMSIMS
jgi:hypothetical protein